MPELTIATWNVHWGRGGRHLGYPPFDLLEHVRRLDVDVLALQETWGPHDGEAQHDHLARELGYEVRSHALSHAVAGRRPHVVARAGEEVPAEHRGRHGAWSMALLSRHPITATRVTRLPQLRVDPSSRAVLHTDLLVEGAPLAVHVTHLPHLEYGAPRITRTLRASLGPADRPAVLLGDMNMWGWCISAMTPPGWRRLRGAATFPARRPVFRIDHLLTTDPVEVLHHEVVADRGSDHLPIRARLRIPAR